MLVLTRKANEGIEIGNDIVLKVLSVTNGRVRVGIEAPSEISIRRSELRSRSAAAADTEIESQDQPAAAAAN